MRDSSTRAGVRVASSLSSAEPASDSGWTGAEADPFALPLALAPPGRPPEASTRQMLWNSASWLASCNKQHNAGHSTTCEREGGKGASISLWDVLGI